MKWCNIIGHKWENNIENIVYYQSPILNGVPVKEVEMPTKVRFCKRCYKKQRMSPRGLWTDWGLTLEESRHIKLKNIGI